MGFEDLMVDDGFHDAEEYIGYLMGQADVWLEEHERRMEELERENFEKEDRWSEPVEDFRDDYYDDPYPEHDFDLNYWPKISKEELKMRIKHMRSEENDRDIEEEAKASPLNVEEMEELEYYDEERGVIVKTLNEKEKDEFFKEAFKDFLIENEENNSQTKEKERIPGNSHDKPGDLSDSNFDIPILELIDWDKALKKGLDFSDPEIRKKVRFAATYVDNGSHQHLIINQESNKMTVERCGKTVFQKKINRMLISDFEKTGHKFIVELQDGGRIFVKLFENVIQIIVYD